MRQRRLVLQCYSTDDMTVPFQLIDFIFFVLQGRKITSLEGTYALTMKLLMHIAKQHIDNIKYYSELMNNTGN